MNRSQRIVISVVGIVIVGIALVGLTYGYFLARIVGNSSEKSITGKLQDLELTYDDQKSTINVTGIKPGDTVGTKTFAVKNNGKEKVDSYAVVLESVTNTLKRKDDLLFSLTCSSGCNGVEETVFPAKDTVIVTNSIDVGKTQTYTLTIKYKNFDTIDQSVDMGAEFGAKVNIADTQSVNPYTSGTLAYEIFNNALVATSETYAATEFSYAPKTKPAQETSGSDERTLSVAPDKYGNSYYFRGNIEDNYVTFGSMCWRVVRIQGDGSVKIILQDRSGPCSSKTTNGTNAFISDTKYVYGSFTLYTSIYESCNTSNCLRTNLQNWFNEKFATSGSTQTAPSNTKPTLKSAYTNKLKYETWEIGDRETKYAKNGEKTESTTWYTESYVRMANYDPSLMPSTSSFNRTVSDYVSVLNGDEVAFAGGAFKSRAGTGEFYLTMPDSTRWWGLDVAYFGPGSGFDSENSFYAYAFGEAYGKGDTGAAVGYARPAIVLTSTVTTAGRGTKDNPYVVSSE